MIIAGSGTNRPVARALAQGFQRHHPGEVIDVPASIGSTGGIQAAAAGAIPLGLISRELREKEKGLGLTVVSWASPSVSGWQPARRGWWTRNF